MLGLLNIHNVKWLIAHQRQRQIVGLLKATKEKKIDALRWILQQKEPFGTIILQNPTFIRLFIVRYCIGRQTAQFETRLSMQKITDIVQQESSLS